MSTMTVEVLISEGQVVVPSGSKLPSHARGWLTVVQENAPEIKRRAVLPVIQASPGMQIAPTREQLDSSFWEEDEAG